MEFVLSGFHQDRDIRRFAFQAIAADRTRQEITVGADLTLIRKYRIPLQELPLLCRRLLEGITAGAESTTLMFTENDMAEYAKGRADAESEAAQKRRAHRVPTSSRVGEAWRSR